MISVVLLDIICLVGILVISSGSLLEIVGDITDEEPLGVFGSVMSLGILAGLIFVWSMYIDHNIIFNNDLNALIESMKQEVKHVWHY